MSPLKKRTTGTEAATYGNPFVGPYNHTHAVRVDVSTLTQAATGTGAGHIDTEGYLRPGAPIQLHAGGVVGAVTGAAVTAADQKAGLVIEPIKVLEEGETPATGTDQDVALAFHCAVNRAIVEDNIGRALTAAEITALRNADVLVLE